MYSLKVGEDYVRVNPETTELDLCKEGPIARFRDIMFAEEIRMSHAAQWPGVIVVNTPQGK